MCAPGAPAARRVLEQRVGVARDRRPLVRGEPLQREGHRLPRGDRELGAAGKVLVDQRHAGRDAHRIGAGYGVDRAVDPLHPWHPFAIVEADAQFGAQVHGAPHAAHDAHHLVRAVARGLWHEVGHRGRAVRRLPGGLQHHRAGQIASRDTRLRMVGAQAPVAVALVAQQAGEHGRGVEAGQAQPVDAAVAVHERGAVGGADESVVLDTAGRRLA